MTVYKVTPLFREHSAEVIGMLQQTGVVETHGERSLVRMPDGHRVLYDRWSPTPSEAWESAGEVLDGIAEHMREKADACRTRATEEVLS
jgi:hypothetical protein